MSRKRYKKKPKSNKNTLSRIRLTRYRRLNNGLNNEIEARDDRLLPEIPDLCGFIDRKKAAKNALDYTTRTTINETNDEHKACVCTVCDSYIIGIEPVCWLSKSDILNKRHLLSASYLTNMIQTTIPSELCDQYKIHSENEFADLLLSPRSQIKDNMYMSCEQCHRNIKHSKRNKPPKFAISNGWAIGSIPTNIVGDIDTVLASMVNKIRLFSYVFTFSAGAHKAIKGHHTFFMNDPEKIGAALHHLQTSGNLTDVYAMLCGRFTPTQREIAKKRCLVQPERYKKLLNWLIDHHPAYHDVQRPEDSPQPTLIGGFIPTQNNQDREDRVRDICRKYQIFICIK